MHVLILGARAPACLEWARAFRAAGWQVTVADSLARPITRSSNAIDAYIRLPEPRSDPSVWIAALQEIVSSRNIDMILPTCEEVFYLAYGKAQLSLHCQVLVADMSTMHRLHHKYQFSRLALELSINAPETRLLETPGAVMALASQSADWVFKPAYSRFARQTLIRPPPNLLSQVRPDHAQPWVAQRFVAGKEYCSFSFLNEGNLTAHACYQPRYRVGRGSGIYFQPSEVSAIQDFLVQFGAMTGYTGQVGFDFIESPDGRLHVLECNPRATSGVHLFGDQSRALVASLSAGQQASVLLQSPEPRMIAFAMLLFVAPRQAFLADFWRNFGQARDVVTSAGDRGPLFGQFVGLLEIIGRALARRCGLIAAATADIEWDGQPMDDTAR